MYQGYRLPPSVDMLGNQLPLHIMPCLCGVGYNITLVIEMEVGYLSHGHYHQPSLHSYKRNGKGPKKNFNLSPNVKIEIILCILLYYAAVNIFSLHPNLLSPFLRHFFSLSLGFFSTPDKSFARRMHTYIYCFPYTRFYL